MQYYHSLPLIQTVKLLESAAVEVFPSSDGSLDLGHEWQQCLEIGAFAPNFA